MFNSQEELDAFLQQQSEYAMQDGEDMPDEAYRHDEEDEFPEELYNDNHLNFS